MFARVEPVALAEDGMAVVAGDPGDDQYRCRRASTTTTSPARPWPNPRPPAHAQPRTGARSADHSEIHGQSACAGITIMLG